MKTFLVLIFVLMLGSNSALADSPVFECSYSVYRRAQDGQEQLMDSSRVSFDLNTMPNNSFLELLDFNSFFLRLIRPNPPELAQFPLQLDLGRKEPDGDKMHKLVVVTKGVGEVSFEREFRMNPNGFFYRRYRVNCGYKSGFVESTVRKALRCHSDAQRGSELEQLAEQVLSHDAETFHLDVDSFQISNYVVKNGYGLKFEKDDQEITRVEFSKIGNNPSIHLEQYLDDFGHDLIILQGCI